MRIFGLILLTCLSFGVSAEQMQRFGELEVHYIVIPSTMIPADMATAYGIKRSSRRAIVNISVIRYNQDQMPEPVPATVSVTQRRLIGTEKELDLIEIVENGARYYLAPFGFVDQDYFTFIVDVKTETMGHHQLSFQQQVFVE